MRRSVLPLTLVLLSGCGGHEEPVRDAGLGPDRPAYDLELAHRPGHLDGDERIGFHNPFGRPLTHVWVRTWANAFGTCARPRIRLRAVDGRIVAQRAACTAARIDLPRPVAPGHSGSVRVQFALTVPRRFDRFGSLRAVDYLGNALPILAVSRDGAEPALPRYTFYGESFFSLTSSWRVDLTLAPGERVAATGTEAARDGRVVTLTAPAERDFMLVAGPLEELDMNASGVRVRWWSPPGTSTVAARSGVRMTARSLTALQDRLGPYGAPEIDAVSSPAHVAATGIAMEYPQLILSPPYAPAVSHELAHQWFYRLVGDDEWRDPWVDETLAEYTAVRLGVRIHGPDRLRGCAQHDRPARPPARVDLDMGELERLNRRRAHLIRDALYIEAPCALFDLTRRAGDARMDAFWRKLVADYRNRVLTTAELVARLRALPGGPDALKALRIPG